jgi:hypothetical protein
MIKKPKLLVHAPIPGWPLRMGLLYIYRLLFYWDPHPDYWANPNVEPKLAVYADLGPIWGRAECAIDWDNCIITYKNKRLPGNHSEQMFWYAKNMMSELVESFKE